MRARIRALSPVRLLARLAALMGAARRRARDRATLAEMPQRLARDVGLTDASRAPMPPPARMPDFW
ncbi:hypothetical protein [Salinarimonas chemoclinalis]|uniref:hypothetical protein n=1 Tax=Salinarimonas chemoclinalis TaxID=3241599 RepID=UPI003556E696